MCNSVVISVSAKLLFIICEWSPWSFIWFLGYGLSPISSAYVDYLIVAEVRGSHGDMLMGIPLFSRQAYIQVGLHQQITFVYFYNICFWNITSNVCYLWPKMLILFLLYTSAQCKICIAVCVCVQRILMSCILVISWNKHCFQEISLTTYHHQSTVFNNCTDQHASVNALLECFVSSAWSRVVSPWFGGAIFHSHIYYQVHLVEMSVEGHYVMWLYMLEKRSDINIVIDFVS